MNERLLQFLAAENISQSQFAETIGVARASVSHIIAGRNRPGYDFICSLLERYPSLNPEWILLGKGKMYRSSSKDASAPAPEKVADTGTGTGTIHESLLEPDMQSIVPQEENTHSPAEGMVQGRQASGLAQGSPAGSMASPMATLHAPEAGLHTPGTGYHGPENSFPDLKNGRAITRIVVFYSDNTFQELHG